MSAKNYNSSKTTFEETLVKFKPCMRIHKYPKTIIERSHSGVHFVSRQSALTQRKRLMRDKNLNMKYEILS